jgi:hypothetical protein
VREIGSYASLDRWPPVTPLACGLSHPDHLSDGGGATAVAWFGRPRGRAALIGGHGAPESDSRLLAHGRDPGAKRRTGAADVLMRADD